MKIKIGIYPLFTFAIPITRIACRKRTRSHNDDLILHRREKILAPAAGHRHLATKTLGCLASHIYAQSRTL